MPARAATGFADHYKGRVRATVTGRAGRMRPMHDTNDPSPALSAALRARTNDLHRQAERSGIVARILAGRASPAAYALLLRNLQPVYRIVEERVNARPTGALAHLLPAALRRCAAIESDLDRLDATWRERPLLAAGQRYAEHLAHCAREAEHLLLAHAYTRYLGDLSGGQVMRKLLAQHMGLDDGALAFYTFPSIGDVAAQRDSFRQQLDRARLNPAQRNAVIEEAAIAFEHNIAISEAVLAAAVPA